MTATWSHLLEPPRWGYRIVVGLHTPGLRDVRVAHIAPPWADIGLYLRHGSDGEHNNADSSPEGTSLSSLALRVGMFLSRDCIAHTSGAEARGRGGFLMAVEHGKVQ